MLDERGFACRKQKGDPYSGGDKGKRHGKKYLRESIQLLNAYEERQEGIGRTCGVLPEQ